VGSKAGSAMGSIPAMSLGGVASRGRVVGRGEAMIRFIGVRLVEGTGLVGGRSDLGNGFIRCSDNTRWRRFVPLELVWM